VQEVLRLAGELARELHVLDDGPEEGLLDGVGERADEDLRARERERARASMRGSRREEQDVEE